MQLFGVIPGGGEVGSRGGVVDRGGRWWSKMEAMPPSTNHSDEDVIGFLGLWIGGWVAIGWQGGSREGEFRLVAKWRRRACRRRFEALRELILQGEGIEGERVVVRCSKEAGVLHL